jgi:hypothetical protein
MIDKLKAVCCFDLGKYENNLNQIIELNANENLDDCKMLACQYYTLSPETAQTIRNTPWEAEPFLFSMKVLKPNDNADNIIQIIPVGDGWRRRRFSNRLETWWGKWMNIGKIVDFIHNADENTQKNLSENWNKYMIIDENNHKKRMRVGNIITIDEIIEEIKTGTAKIFKNKFI